MDIKTVFVVLGILLICLIGGTLQNRFDLEKMKIEKCYFVSKEDEHPMVTLDGNSSTVVTIKGVGG